MVISPPLAPKVVGYILGDPEALIVDNVETPTLTTRSVSESTLWIKNEPLKCSLSPVLPPITILSLTCNPCASIPVLNVAIPVAGVNSDALILNDGPFRYANASDALSSPIPLIVDPIPTAVADITSKVLVSPSLIVLISYVVL